METNESTLLVEQRGAQLWVTFNRADKANALTVDLMKRATTAILDAMHTPEVQAVLLTGGGTRVFCAGVDVREAPPDGNVGRHREKRSLALAALQDAIIDVPKPVVAVLNGTASGGGAMIALLADACVAVDSAELSMPEINLGIATFSGANILEVVGGRALARSLVQTGRRMSMHEAKRHGIVESVVTRSELVPTATALAETLGSKNATAFTENKHWMNRTVKATLLEARTEHARYRVASAGHAAHSPTSHSVTRN